MLLKLLIRFQIVEWHNKVIPYYSLVSPPSNLLAYFSNWKGILSLSLSFQDGRPVCAQEVHQDDEDLQPRQGLQEEQQVRYLLRSPQSATLIQKTLQWQLTTKKSHSCQNFQISLKNLWRGPIKNDLQIHCIVLLWVSLVCEIHIYLYNWSTLKYFIF